jgi:hypothetical protein
MFEILSLISMEDLGQLFSLQLEMDRMYEERVNGTFVRSRRRWLEEGEEKKTYAI